jgi:uncharacterized protein
MAHTFRNNRSRRRFEIEIDGEVAFAEYQESPEIVTFTHTEVPKALSGLGVGKILARKSLEDVQAQRRLVVAQCPFIANFIQKTPEFGELLKRSE